MIFILLVGFIPFWLKLTLANRLIYRGPDQVVLNDAETLAKVPEEFVTLPLDHANAAASTFRNRFFVKADWYKKGGPVFLYDGGEGAADTSYIKGNSKTSYENLSFFERFLKDHGGLGIVWEHRYYGKSLPPGRNLEQSKEEDFKYLTTQQALSDVVAFARSFSRSGTPFDGLDLTPAKTPWIFVGCSYPGSRAALMRVAHPDTIFASYAASAPVQAAVAMSSYWEPTWSGMRKYGYSNCTADMHAAIVAIDARLSKSATDAFNIKRQIFGCTDPALSDGNFASSLSNLWTTWQSYDMNPDQADPPRPGIKQMCDFISYNPDTRSYSDAGGWAKVHRNGVDFTLGRLRSWPGFTTQASFNETQISCPSTPPSASVRCEKDDEVDNISWKYQYCTEWGYWQVGNPGNSQIVSKFYDLNFYRQQCLCQFQYAGKGPRTIPDTPRADLINQKYGGWNMRPSRTFFTVGEFDPWRTLSPLKVDNTTIPDCEASTAPGTPLFGKVLSNKQHCGDFDSTDPDARAVHKLFSDALKKWLCCYTEKNKGNLNNGAKDVLCPKL
ncbi:hypothetical protein LTR67_006701 [Exophiala xenobiotica]